MKKILGFLLGLTLLTGCANSLALLGPTSTAVTGGNIAQSTVSSVVNYGIKKQTGKSAMEHALAYAEEINPEKKKEPCLSFAEKTNSEICAIVKKQLELTKSKFSEKSIKDLTSSLKPYINKIYNIKRLD
tara:strand:+ start:222 stop:611 length:390 start_codon:yes stop_codon:yes gene_type:complete